jgi:cytochrome c oxidase assembly protein subunit 15
VRRLAFACCSLVFLQLVIAAIMRHNYAGLSIPTFPASTPDGHWLPAVWNFRVGIHFAHRLMAAALTIALGWFAIRIWTDRAASLGLRCGASVLVSLLAFQILLGAYIIWSQRAVTVTTGHVLIGACTLVTTFWLTWLAHRDVIEKNIPA